MKNLIVTADDYGVFPSINNGVKEAIRKGKVNSVACFSNHKDSVKNVKELLDEFENKVDIGCHFTLSSGEPLIVKNNEAFTHGKNFNDFSNLDINGILKQPNELKKELIAQVQVFKDNQIPVNHLSCHCNTLTTVKGLFKTYLEVAALFKIPMRSVNIQPDKKDNSYRMALNLMLADNVPTSILKEIRNFQKEINQTVADYKLVKTPGMLESSHYGPLPFYAILDISIDRRKKDKHDTIKKFLKTFQDSTHQHAELMVHLVNYPDYLSGIDDDIDYTGVNTKYFDSRQIEQKSILEFDYTIAPNISLGGWSQL